MVCGANVMSIGAKAKHRVNVAITYSYLCFNVFYKFTFQIIADLIEDRWKLVKQIVSLDNTDVVICKEKIMNEKQNTVYGFIC